MKITELEKQRIRLGKSSITCVDENGKTRGVVRGLESLKSCQNPRTEWAIVGALKKAGIWADCLKSGLKDQVFMDGGKLYYINNLKPMLFFTECCEGKDEAIIESERERFNKLLDIAKKAEATMTVINCYIVNQALAPTPYRVGAFFCPASPSLGVRQKPFGMDRKLLL